MFHGWEPGVPVILAACPSAGLEEFQARLFGVASHTAAAADPDGAQGAVVSCHRSGRGPRPWGSQ